MAMDTFLRGVGPHLTTDTPRPRSWTGNCAARGASCEAGRAVRGQHPLPRRVTSSPLSPLWLGTRHSGLDAVVVVHTQRPGYRASRNNRTGRQWLSGDHRKILSWNPRVGQPLQNHCPPS